MPPVRNQNDSLGQNATSHTATAIKLVGAGFVIQSMRNSPLQSADGLNPQFLVGNQPLRTAIANPCPFRIGERLHVKVSGETGLSGGNQRVHHLL